MSTSASPRCLRTESGPHDHNSLKMLETTRGNIRPLPDVVVSRGRRIPVSKFPSPACTSSKNSICSCYFSRLCAKTWSYLCQTPVLTAPSRPRIFRPAARQQTRSQQPARMPRLAPIERGPWASRKAATRRDFGEGLDGPDYDPGIVHRVGVCCMCNVCCESVRSFQP